MFSAFSLLFFVYDARAFNTEATLTAPGAERPPGYLLAFLGAPLLVILPWLLAVSWRECHDSREAVVTIALQGRVTRWGWLSLTLAFMLFHLATRWFEVFTGVIDAADLEARLYRDLSTATATGLPLYALFYLLGLGGVAFHWAESLERGGLWWWHGRKTPPSSRLREAIGLLSRVLGILLFFAFTEVVLYATTGGSWLDHLLSVGRRVG